MESIDKVQGTFEMKQRDVVKSSISDAVIKRLPRYHRYLGDLLADGRLLGRAVENYEGDRIPDKTGP